MSQGYKPKILIVDEIERTKKEELHEIYKKIGGLKSIEELKNSEFNMLSGIYYIDKAKKGKSNEQKTKMPKLPTPKTERGKDIEFLRF